MLGLTLIGRGESRRAREEFQILTDPYAYDMVKAYASAEDIENIDGWARSFYTLEGHLNSITMYCKPLLPRPSDPEWTDTCRKIANEFSSFPRVSSLPFESGFDSVRYESASAAGFGYVGRKGEGDNFARAKRIANAAIRSYSEDIEQHGISATNNLIVRNSTPDIAFTRTQLAKLPSIKVRNVFGEAFHYILIEGLTAFPLLEAFKSRDSFYFTGRDPTIAIPILLEEQERSTKWYSVVDWSNFDASVQTWEIDHAFNCLLRMITFPTTLSKLAFDYSHLLFKERKLLGPDGRLWLRIGGIPSGSYFTNLVGSIINYTRISYLMRKMNTPYNRIVVQGDDSITFIKESTKPDPREFSQLGEPYGWTVKPDKCIITDDPYDVIFLGRSARHRYNYRDRLKALRLICFPEFEVDDPAVSTARVHSISHDAGHIDPLFDQLYCAMYQQYGEAHDVPTHLLPYFEKDIFM